MLVYVAQELLFVIVGCARVLRPRCATAARREADAASATGRRCSGAFMVVARVAASAAALAVALGGAPAALSGFCTCSTGVCGASTPAA